MYKEKSPPLPSGGGGKGREGRRRAAVEEEAMKEEEGMKDEETGMQGKDERGMHSRDKDVSASAGACVAGKDSSSMCLRGTRACGLEGVL
jgi:hypothetical protein